MRRKKYENPDFSTGIILGGIAATVGLIWWGTKKATAATTQSLVQGAVSSVTPPVLSYGNDVHGRVLTPAEVASINANPNQPLTGTESAMLAQMRANFARVNPQ